MSICDRIAGYLHMTIQTAVLIETVNYLRSAPLVLLQHFIYPVLLVSGNKLMG